MNKALVNWTSKSHPTIALSKIEAEYQVFFEATKDVVYLRRVIGESKIICSLDPTNIISNNQSCIRFKENT